MIVILALLAQILHIGLMIVAAPTVAGALDWLGARLSGRAGPALLLPWRDLARLSRKTPVTIGSVSVVSRLAPAVGLGATLTAAALVPSFTLEMGFAPLADVLVIVSLMAMARIAAAVAAFDSGAAVPGLAAQSASALSVIADPALMLCVVTLGLIGGSFNLDLIIGQQREGLLLPEAASTVVLTAMLALVFSEAGDGTAKALDSMFSGTDLAVSLMAVWLRRLVWADLIGGLFLPIGMSTADSGLLAWLTGLFCWSVKLAAFVVGLVAAQMMLGRVRRNSLSYMAGVAALLALLAFVMVLANAGTA